MVRISVLYYEAPIRIGNGQQSVYVRTKRQSPPYLIHEYRTPLYPKLRNVDLEMQQNKVATLKIAFKQLSDTIISQSEVPSYRKTIGRPTKRRGYVDGMILHDGKVTIGVGGGLCQLSNTLY